jgi:hypothetical protein
VRLAASTEFRAARGGDGSGGPAGAYVLAVPLHGGTRQAVALGDLHGVDAVRQVGGDLRQFGVQADGARTWHEGRIARG